MGLFKKKGKSLSDHKILIAYGDQMGIFDVWEFGKLKKKFALERAIAVIKKKPTDKVYDEADKNGVEIIISNNPRQHAEHLKRELEAPDKKVGVKKLEEVADRSLSQDPC